MLFYNHVSSLSAFIKSLKDKLLKYSEHDELALGISYLTGNKDELTALQKENMKNVGVMHLIAVSGTHLAIIAGVLSLIFKHFSIIGKTYFVLIFCFIYAMMIWCWPVNIACVCRISLDDDD